MTKIIKNPKFNQARNWCFTDFDMIEFEKIYEEYNDIVRYIGWGLEKCPKTGKMHQQGWVQFVNKKRIGGVKKIMGSKKIHLEACRGSEIENEKYCAKDNNFKFLGRFKVQGQRSDLESIKKALDAGENLMYVAENHFGDFIRYHKGFQAYKKMVDKKRTKKFRDIQVTFVTGPTGTNKTRNAVESNPDAYMIQGANLKWFDGYDMEKTLIIDEYNNDIGITGLLNLLDGYQLRLETKGSHTYANWNKVVITTNLKKEEIHAQAKEAHIAALGRRVTKWDDIWEKIENANFDLCA